MGARRPAACWATACCGRSCWPAVGALLFISGVDDRRRSSTSRTSSAPATRATRAVRRLDAGMVAGATALPPRVPPAAVAARARRARRAGRGHGRADRVGRAPRRARGLPRRRRRPRGQEHARAHGDPAARRRAAHGRAFAAYNAARNAAELGALGAGGVLVGGDRRPPTLVIAGLGPMIAALLGLAPLRHQRPQHRRRRLAPRLQPSPQTPESDSRGIRAASQPAGGCRAPPRGTPAGRRQRPANRPLEMRRTWASPGGAAEKTGDGARARDGLGRVRAAGAQHGAPACARRERGGTGSTGLGRRPGSGGRRSRPAKASSAAPSSRAAPAERAVADRCRQLDRPARARRRRVAGQAMGMAAPPPAPAGGCR